MAMVSVGNKASEISVFKSKRLRMEDRMFGLKKFERLMFDLIKAILLLAPKNCCRISLLLPTIVLLTTHNLQLECLPEL